MGFKYFNLLVFLRFRANQVIHECPSVREDPEIKYSNTEHMAQIGNIIRSLPFSGLSSLNDFGNE